MAIIARMLLALLLSVASNSAALAQSLSPDIQEIFDRGCGDDRGNDRCSADGQRTMREAYGIASAEALADQGVTLRRAMIVDGYGSDLVAITFSRAPGKAPAVAIATPRQDGMPEPQPLAAVIDQGTWQLVLAASRDFDQQLARELPANRNPLDALCLHGWFVVVEAVDAARLSQNVIAQQVDPTRIRRDAEGSCARGLAEPYAFELARIALEHLPECSALDAGEARNDAALLALCHRLGGDRIAASDAYRFLEKLRQRAVLGLPDLKELSFEFFAESANQFIEPFKSALDGGNFYFNAPRASDVDHATVEGQVLFPAGEASQVADIKLTLVWQAGDFTIQSYQISDKRPIR